MSTILKQTLVLILLLSGLAQQTQANDAPAPDTAAPVAAAPAQAPVQLSWDRVGERERNWV